MSPIGVNAQDENTKSFMVYPSFTIGIGFFYPGDVNEYIEKIIAPVYTDITNEELYMYYEFRGGITYRLKNFDFAASLEYDIAPKIVFVVNGGNITYSYSRIAPEISADYFIPNSTGKHAFFLGGGINYSFMKFKEFSASAPGFMVRGGYSMQFKKFNLQPYAQFRYVKATDQSDFLVYEMIEKSSFDLSYTGFQIGAIISLHSRLLYK